MRPIYDLWMEAHAKQAMDSRVTVDGNRHDPGTVIATIRFMDRHADTMYKLQEPEHEDLIHWMKQNNMADEVEYLMDENQ